MEFECLAEARCDVGESPVWDAANERLYWTDNTAGEVHAIDLADRRRQVWRFPEPTGSLAIARSGKLLVALRDTIVVFDPSTGRSEPFVHVALAAGVAKLNDGKVGPDGAFWVGTMADKEPDRLPVASLFRVTTDGRVEEKIAGGIKVSNGLAWSADGGTLFHSDSRGSWIDSWRFDPRTGDISDRRRLRDLSWEEGLPDGAATDVEGYYWSAGFSAQAINCFSADGELVRRIAVPGPATMPCFGGADRKSVFVTTLRAHVGDAVLERYPQSGSVFMARSDVAGVPVSVFDL